MAPRRVLPIVASSRELGRRVVKDLLQRVRQRKLWQWSIAYLAAAWLLMEVVDLLGDTWNWSPIVGRLVFVGLMAGFAISVVVAWFHGERGLQRVTGLETILILAILAAGSLTAIQVSRMTQSGGAGPRDGLPANGRPVLAVLPFENIGSDAEQEYFSDGITEELLNTLGRIRQLRVLARSWSFAFSGRPSDVRAIVDSLGIDYVVEGSVRRAGDSLRITAQLIDARDGSHVWAGEYDRQLEDVFAIQSEIARTIADSLRVPLGLGLVLPTTDIEAYDLYLAGRALLRTRADIARAVTTFREVIVRDSSWAPAWAGLAESHALVPYFDEGRTNDSTVWARNLDAAEVAARRALELDPNNDSALLALANVYRDYWKHERAEKAYSKALSLDPDNAEAHHEYGDFLAGIGRVGEAYAAAHRSLRLDPAPVRLNDAAISAAANGRIEEAEALLDRGLAMDPPPKLRDRMRGNRTWVYRVKGDWREYRQRLLQRLRAEDSEALKAVWPKDGSATPEAAALLTEWSSILGAVFWMRLGEYEQAIDALEKRYSARPPYGPSGDLFDRSFDPLRSHPRFQALLASRGLEGRYPERLE